LVKTSREIRPGIAHVESPDHSGIAEIFKPRIGAKRLRAPVQISRGAAIALDYLVARYRASLALRGTPSRVPLACDQNLAATR